MMAETRIFSFTNALRIPETLEGGLLVLFGIILFYHDGILGEGGVLVRWEREKEEEEENNLRFRVGCYVSLLLLMTLSF